MAPKGRYQFPKGLRLRRRREFLEVQRNGRRLRGRFMTVIARLSDRSSERPTRLGVTVSRKVGSAVVRNRTKRLLREAFRLGRHDLPPAMDLVAVAKPRAGRACFGEIRTELLDLAQILGRRLGAEERG